MGYQRRRRAVLGRLLGPATTSTFISQHGRLWGAPGPTLATVPDRPAAHPAGPDELAGPADWRDGLFLHNEGR